jgi:hypothetical protein
MRHSFDGDSNKRAIEILHQHGYIVSDTGILQIVDEPNESSVTLYPWERIKQIQTHKIGANNRFITIRFWLSDEAAINIDLKNKDNALIVYKFLADKRIIYGMGTPLK